jgi:hypothetical protein
VQLPGHFTTASIPMRGPTFTKRKDHGISEARHCRPLGHGCGPSRSVQTGAASVWPDRIIAEPAVSKSRILSRLLRHRAQPFDRLNAEAEDCTARSCDSSPGRH